MSIISRPICFQFLSVLTLISTTLAGCSASGPKFQELTAPNKESAEIVLYRPSHFAGAGSSFKILLDETKVGTLKNGGYITIQTAPGTHILKVNSIHKPLSTSISLARGERKFYRFETTGNLTPGYVVFHYQLSAVSEEIAESQIKELHQSN